MEAAQIRGKMSVTQWVWQITDNRGWLICSNTHKAHHTICYTGYSEERRKSVKLQQPYIQEEEDIVRRYLFDNKDIEEAKREITSFWKIRERIRKEREREKQKSDKGRTQTQTTEHIRECR